MDWYEKTPTYKYRVTAPERVFLFPKHISIDVGAPEGGYVSLFGSDHHEYAHVYADKLIVYFDYRWDGGTGAIDDEDMIRASCVHDPLCQMINLGLIPDWNQKPADRLLAYELGQAQKEGRQKMKRGISRAKWFVLDAGRRGWVYAGVRVFQRAKRIHVEKPLAMDAR